jgi:D-inositol-3-phosphate glycosyltransferase
MVQRVAMLSAHTSPLEQPGSGAAGGMNVYVLETARQLARRGIDVDVFARATPAGVFDVELEPGLRVHQVEPGALAMSLMREPASFDVIHSHYWISGQIGLFAKERLGTPLLHAMHTMGRVKNLSLAAGESPEPSGRITAEAEIVRHADRLVANTARERDELVGLYGADRERVDVVHPGVDHTVFTSGRRDESRRRLDIPPEEQLVLFVGRIQPHKAPDVLVRAVAQLRPRPRLVIIGGRSGAEMRLGAAAEVLPPVAHPELADWYAAADVVCVPSHSESFGLVALESQACGTPVVAARVGGLTTAVVDGVTGLLVDGHDPRAYAAAIDQLLGDPALHAAMSAKAVAHASGFTWQATTDRLLESYAKVVA